MTDREHYLLLQAAQVDLPAALYTALPLPLCTVLRACHSPLAHRCGASAALGALQLTHYINDNPGPMTNTDTLCKSGFVGYALRSPAGDGYALYRASEGDTPADVFTDWGSNLTAALGATIPQHLWADRLFKQALAPLPGEKTAMGHSKGGNLAAYAFLHNLALQPRGYIVNGQPLYYPALCPAWRRAMHSAAMRFVVHRGDVVSAMGYVDYIDAIVALRPGVQPGVVRSHRLESAAFDRHGNLIPLQQNGSVARALANAAVVGLQLVLQRMGLPAQGLGEEAFTLYCRGVGRVFAALQRGRFTAARAHAAACCHRLRALPLPPQVALGADHALHAMVRAALQGA